MNTAVISQLNTFLSVARLRSFSAAARELGVSTPAVSQAVRQLEQHLNVVLLNRTTRSVSTTDAGRRLLENAGPALGQLVASLQEVSAQPGEAVGRLRLSVPRDAIPFVLAPVLPTFRKRHPRIEVEVVADDRFVDIVAEGYDAGMRLSEALERDMVQVRLTQKLRFVVVASPEYLDRHGTPERPEDLLKHECLTVREETTGTLYAWEFERGRKNWCVPVRGGVVTNDTGLRVLLAEHGVGLTYVGDQRVAEQLQDGRLVAVLDAYAPTVPGLFLYFPSRAQRSPALRLFADAAKELLNVGK